MEFAKLEACGNDFIITEAPVLSAAEICNFCHRQLGIGADGLIFTGPDLRLRIFNSDGTEAEMCGNGLRALALYHHNRRGLKKMLIPSMLAMHECEVTADAVKVQLAAAHSYVQHTDCSFINTGVPHAVVWTKDLASVNIAFEGKQLRHDARFGKAGSNVNFANLQKDILHIRTYERGVEAETFACGTGAVASALIAAKEQGLNSPVTVQTALGHKLHIYFDATFSKIFLQGPAREIYSGKTR